MPDSHRRCFAEKAERDALARVYGGKQAHEHATALGQTELSYDDWLTVRTAAFKVWFGDWEAARGVGQLCRTRPLNLDGLQLLSDKKAVEDAFRAFGKVENINEGLSVTFPANTAGKVLRHKGFNVGCIITAFDRLFAGAVLMFVEAEQTKVGHKTHPGSQAITTTSPYLSRTERHTMCALPCIRCTPVGRNPEGLKAMPSFTLPLYQRSLDTTKAGSPLGLMPGAGLLTQS